MRSGDVTDIHAQEAARKAREEQARVGAQQDAADVAWLMRSTRGRRILWGVLARAGIFQTSFSTVALDMARREGMKQEGFRTLALINAAAPTMYPVMVQENAR